MAPTVYAHMNKWIKNFKNKKMNQDTKIESAQIGLFFLFL
jgi:hypothetical protein